MESESQNQCQISNEGVNIATYYILHESENEESKKEVNTDVINEDIMSDASDNDHGISSMSLNYSKEDIQNLATQAEIMVLRRRKTNVSQTRPTSYHNQSDDSDYCSRFGSNLAIGSEPNIQLQRRSPNRRLINAKTKRWRHSMPANLEFYTNNSEYEIKDTLNPVLDEDSEQESSCMISNYIEESSLAEISSGELSISQESSENAFDEIWDDEKLLTNKHGENVNIDEESPKSFLSFGDDYSQYLALESDESDDFSSKKKTQTNQKRRRHNKKDNISSTQFQNVLKIKDVNQMDCMLAFMLKQKHFKSSLKSLKSSLQNLQQELLTLDNYGIDSPSSCCLNNNLANYCKVVSSSQKYKIEDNNTELTKSTKISKDKARILTQKQFRDEDYKSSECDKIKGKLKNKFTTKFNALKLQTSDCDKQKSKSKTFRNEHNNYNLCKYRRAFQTSMKTSLFLLSVISTIYFVCEPQCCDSNYWTIYDVFKPKFSYPFGPPPI